MPSFSALKFLSCGIRMHIDILPTDVLLAENMVLFF